VLEGGFDALDQIAAHCRRDRGAWETWSALVLDRMAGGGADAPFLVPRGAIAARSPADASAPSPPGSRLVPPPVPPSPSQDAAVRVPVPSGIPSGSGSPAS
jgi:hypothetical protein